jgi:hypothetical protein
MISLFLRFHSPWTYSIVLCLVRFVHARRVPTMVSSTRRTNPVTISVNDVSGYCNFNQRPIPEAIASYCVSDVQCLPMLHNKFKLALSIHRDTQPVVQFETRKPVASTHAPDYQPYGRERALAPWSAEQNMILNKSGLMSSGRQTLATVMTSMSLTWGRETMVITTMTKTTMTSKIGRGSHGKGLRLDVLKNITGSTMARLFC